MDKVICPQCADREKYKLEGKKEDCGVCHGLGYIEWPGGKLFAPEYKPESIDKELNEEAAGALDKMIDLCIRCTPAQPCRRCVNLKILLKIHNYKP